LGHKVLNKQKDDRSKWARFWQEISLMFIFWIFGIFLLGVFRIIFIIYFHDKIGTETTISDFAKTIMMGFRFDSAAVSLFLIIPFLCNAVLQPFNLHKIVYKSRKIFLNAFLFVSLLTSIVTLSYFKEYDSQFNYFLFEAIYDDQVAIAKTIFEQYHPFLSITLFAILLWISFYIVKMIELHIVSPKIILELKNRYLKILVVLLVCVLFFGSARGSFKRRPAMRKWSGITKDEFLNKTIVTPIRSLVYALRDFRRLQIVTDNNPYLKDSDISDALKNITGNFNNFQDLNSYLANEARGEKIKMPNHIILLVMESYDSWPLQDKYTSLHLTDNLRRIGETGIHFKNFLPQGPSTFSSLSSIVSGIPYAGISVSIRGAKGGPACTSVFEQMERLGYETFFFYGGFMSWHNLGNYIKNQGANNMYSAAHAGGKTVSGVWGADDDQLYELVLKKIPEGKKTFSIILTTSYHGPFTIDVIGHGYPYENVSDYPKTFQALHDGSNNPNVLGHLWFTDKALGDFIKMAESKFPNTLFAITGDHYGRRYFHSRPNLYERSSVPFILYGPQISDDLMNSSNPGTHIDIFPTIVELIAPKGYKYKSFGKALQYKNSDDIAVAYQTAINKDSTWSIIPGRSISQWDGKEHRQISWDEIGKLSSRIDKTEIIIDKFNWTAGVGWQFVMRGEKFFTEPSERNIRRDR
jgi:phosphoglycerol transferase MdoB-like AlkP superfamily enzyme